MILGVDTGGTFTDFVLFRKQQIRIHKVLSTPEAPEQAILQGIRELGLDQLAAGELLVVHGSTVATNAALEGKGAKTAFVTNRGFKDILSIGRQARQELYNLTPASVSPPVPPALCFETGGRLSAEAELLEPLTEADLHSLIQAIQTEQPQAVAICLLFSFLDPTLEQALRTALQDSYFVSCSHEVLPDYGEYERGIATWLNASLGPVMQRYLVRLKEHLADVSITMMQSSGGTLALERAQTRAVNLLLSGPAGGLNGARFMGATAERRQLLTFDMGGTSTDVAVIDGEIRLTTEGKIGRWPVGVPMVDMATIGAGGGSIAYVDAGGLLQVGPQSAGASPGPACYGRGGMAVTVTDANVVLGRIQPDFFLGGQMQLSLQSAHQALSDLGFTLGLSAEEAARGVIAIANEHMVRALRMISVERGYDLANFTLCSFGGAGGLHVCALADALGLQRAMVPQYAGVLSAFGMGVAPRVRHLSASHKQNLADLDLQKLEHLFSALEQQGLVELEQETIQAAQIKVLRTVDLRYCGQSFRLNLNWQGDQKALNEAFNQLHEQRYGHRLSTEVELVSVRVQLSADAEINAIDSLAVHTAAEPIKWVTLTGVTQAVAVFEREQLPAGQIIAGPAIIAERIGTTWLEPNWRARMDSFGNLLLEKN